MKSMSITQAIEYIKVHYPEIKLSKKDLKKALLESDELVPSGTGRIGFTTVDYRDRSERVGYREYDKYTVESIDQWAKKEAKTKEFQKKMKAEKAAKRPKQTAKNNPLLKKAKKTLPDWSYQYILKVVNEEGQEAGEELYEKHLFYYGQMK